MDWKAKAIEMRQAAWQELSALPAFVAFMAADKMVVDMGGASMLDSDAPKPSKGIAAAVLKVTTPRAFASGDRPASPSNGDIAFEVLSKKGAPMSTIPLMEECRTNGARIGGKDPINNFRSSLSRDDRFHSFRHEGGYYWWLKGASIPNTWLEAAGPDLLNPPAALSAINQKGDPDAEKT